MPPPKVFATSDEHYKYLFEQAKGGTKHTISSVPRWDGLWVTAGNTHMDMFIDPPGSGFNGKVRAGVLTPPYETAYKERWRQQQELGEVQYDRLTHCEPPGYPRWLLEPYSHEFVNLPQESYMINDYGPGIRRVYIGQEHKNVYGTHSWYGDTIGFWDGNKLVTSTKYLLPACCSTSSGSRSARLRSASAVRSRRVSNRIRLLDLPDDVLGMLERGQLSEGHARAVLAVPDHEGRRRLAREIVQKGLSVRAAEQRAKWAGAKQKPRPVSRPSIPPSQRACATRSRSSPASTQRSAAAASSSRSPTSTSSQSSRKRSSAPPRSADARLARVHGVSAATPLIHARGLRKEFGDSRSPSTASTSTSQRGEAFGFLGPNGAGKSSTMRMIGCVSPPSPAGAAHPRHGPRGRRARRSAPGSASCRRRTRSTSS